MDHLARLYDVLLLQLLPRGFNFSFPGPGGLADQVVFPFTMKGAVSFLHAASSIQATTNGNSHSELPYYGRSPAVYPSRRFNHGN
jgi:hypothetical protein